MGKNGKRDLPQAWTEILYIRRISLYGRMGNEICAFTWAKIKVRMEKWDTHQQNYVILQGSWWIMTLDRIENEICKRNGIDLYRIWVTCLQEPWVMSKCLSLQVLTICANFCVLFPCLFKNMDSIYVTHVLWCLLANGANTIKCTTISSHPRDLFSWWKYRKLESLHRTLGSRFLL